MKELVSIGIVFISIGVIILMIGMISETGKVEGKGAGIIMIGPIPIIFGTDTGSMKTVIVLAITLTVIFFMLSRWRL